MPRDKPRKRCKSIIEVIRPAEIKGESRWYNWLPLSSLSSPFFEQVFSKSFAIMWIQIYCVLDLQSGRTRTQQTIKLTHTWTVYIIVNTLSRVEICCDGKLLLLHAAVAVLAGAGVVTSSWIRATWTDPDYSGSGASKQSSSRVNQHSLRNDFCILPLYLGGLQQYVLYLVLKTVVVFVIRNPLCNHSIA